MFLLGLRQRPVDLNGRLNEGIRLLRIALIPLFDSFVLVAPVYMLLTQRPSARLAADPPATMVGE